MKALNHVLVALAVVVALVSVNQAKAEEATTTASTEGPTWEWTGSTAANYTHNTSAGQGSHSWNVGLGGNYFFNNMYELGATIAFTDQSQTIANIGVETRALELLVGPTFNFMGTPENAFFLTLQGGVLLTGNGDFGPNATQFAYLAGIGRRVEIVKHVTWKPEVAITGNLKNTDSATRTVFPAATSFEIIPFQFSLLF